MGLRAINGGDTTIAKENPWLGRIAPFGLQRGPFWQIYVGMQNENIYTNDWTGPFWGYRRVLETFELTEHPRRLKPINIYYHFYSASKTASLNALKRVYDYVMERKTIPLYTSEYIAVAQDFYATAIEKTANGYRIRNSGNLRTLRLPKVLGCPDIAASKSIVGFKEEKGYRYLHLDGSGDYKLVLQENNPSVPYLIEANARVKSYEKSAERITIKLQGHVGIEADFNLPAGWKAIDTKPQRGWKKRKNTYLLKTAQKQAEVTFVTK